MKLKRIVAIVATVFATQAWADTIADTDFESGITGWTIGGGTGNMTTTITGNGSGVSLVTGSPATVTFSAGSHGPAGTVGSPYYAPAVTPTTWTFSSYGNNMAALQASGGQYSDMVTSLGLTSTDVSEIQTILSTQATASGFGSGTPTSAAWISRLVTLNAGTTYTMAWNYIGTDYVPFNDGSITTLVHSTDTTIIGTVNNYNKHYALLGFTNPGTGDYSTSTFGSTGWQVSTYQVSVSGSYLLGFGSFNLDDTALSPVLLVDSQQGITLKNGTTFGAVAPNPGTSAPSSPGSTSSGPSIVSTTSTKFYTSNWSPWADAGAITILGTTVVNAASETKDTQTIARATTTSTSTPQSRTRPYEMKDVVAYSDNTTTTGAATNTGTDTQNTNLLLDITANDSFSGRIDQQAQLSQLNSGINRSLDSDAFRKDSIEYGKGRVYLTYNRLNSNGGSGYDASSNRYNVGYEQNVKENWILGVQYNYVTTGLDGVDSNTKQKKNHLGLYSIYNRNDWILKSDIGYANNDIKYDRTVEGVFNNSADYSGSDLWMRNRVYTPEFKGFRPYVGHSFGKERLDGYVETGSIQSARTLVNTNTGSNYTEVGLRYEKTINKLTLSGEVGQSSDNYTDMKAEASYKVNQRSRISLSAGRQTHDKWETNVVGLTGKLDF